jgi:hypothetical protein
MNEKEELLEPETIARILDCTPEEVLQLARRGELKATLQDVMAYNPLQEES